MRVHSYLTNNDITSVPCTKILSQKIQIFQKTSFCILRVLLLDFTNTIWQLYIDFYTISIVFESSFQLCICKVVTLNKLWQFWQEFVDKTFVHTSNTAQCKPVLPIEPRVLVTLSSAR